ncbi:MAG: Ig-like domain-containing protein [Candidatus Marinimicrobia bacterium]|jgi:hypothetical protein|nr:Ig-like domain-containing protein [Candidatus Neomarinimicrobiota bacterium]MBT3630884.1 Ig-like domain-containing protein [Candidatus Neomarinimicrobiota bacterium]MBT3826156.1 Ig-like domain-containing protein [Candidatus Neomarinimicrobiota bacterium]MBT4130872.1 Ig-like domain-containing protein [Candidatus Neomarinimicrobiota bacterium]MBT4295665.1 Ig-like domain-containing protein [Candidatus Neomarinimicrobiota bacterium]
MKNNYFRFLILSIVSLTMFLGCDTRNPTEKEEEVVVYNLNLTADRYVIYADNGKTVAKVTAILTNAVNEPQENATIVFSALSGAIASNISTNSSGQAVATFDDKGQPSTQVNIVARYTDGNNNTVRDTVIIQVLPMEDLVSSFFATTIPQSGEILVIREDSTYTATINANVRDSLGVAVKNVLVNYRVLEGSTVGYLDAASDSTNAIGTSHVDFTNNDGLIGSVLIEASVNSSTIETIIDENTGVYEFGSLLKEAGNSGVAYSDTVSINFAAAREYFLTINTLDTTIYGDNGVTVSKIYAVVKDADDFGVDTVRVNFSSSIGTINSPKFTNEAGIAETEFSDLGSTIMNDEIAIIIGSIEHPFYGLVQDTVQVRIRAFEFESPKVPAFINMTTNFDELPPIGLPDSISSRLSLFVSDSNGFPVDEGTEVTFDTDIGFITPFTLTDVDGNASAVFTMGDSSGIAKVYAYSGIASDSVLIHVRPTEASYIVIAPVQPNFIVVQGGWGAESTTLFAEVRDARGELVDESYEVTFQIGPAPSGANLNGTGLFATAETNYGVASATLNAGTEAGPVQLTVSTTTLDEDIIRSTGTPVTIRADLPAHINADIDINAIEPVGGGFYELEVAALVWDQYTNPVEDSTQVYWSLIPDSLGDIIGESFTNNENLNGDAYHGLAWTKLYYNSGMIFSDLQIVARTWGANGDTVRAIVNEDADSTQFLPFFPGNLLVFAELQFHDFQPADNPNPAQVPVQLTAVLTDYYNNPVNNGRILFGAFGAAAWDPLDPETGMPIVRTNDQGIAQITVFFDAGLCTPNFNADNTVNSYNPFTAQVWGTLLDPQSIGSEQVSIQLVRTIQN